jgi:hypothetical protein
LEGLRWATVESSVGLFVSNRPQVEFSGYIGSGSSGGKSVRRRYIFRNTIDTGTRADMDVIDRLEYTAIGSIYMIRNKSKGKEGGSREIRHRVAKYRCLHIIDALYMYECATVGLVVGVDIGEAVDIDVVSKGDLCAIFKGDVISLIFETKDAIFDKGISTIDAEGVSLSEEDLQILEGTVVGRSC